MALYYHKSNYLSLTTILTHRESAFHHNAVFVGMDEKDNPKYAAIRGTGTSFIGEANGSDKNYSFSIFTEKSCDTMHLFVTNSVNVT